MTLSLASNIPALQAAGQLRRATDELSETFERLSSGVRINSAADDPAGLALADSLRADTKIATVAARNANDGISLLSIADAGLEEINHILTRMYELATQSSNGVYTNTQRSALSSEFLALGSEIERISKTTTFNDLNLLSNSNNVTLQVGFDSSSNSQITITAVLGTLSSLNLAASGSGKLTFSIIDTSTAGAQAAATTAMSAINNALGSLTSVRGTLGAAESRLNSAVNFLTVARENLAAAESRIRDIDVAEETAKLVAQQVRQQAASAVLAQANLQPAMVLSLLKGSLG